MAPRWPAEAVEMLQDLYGIYSSRGLASILNREFGRTWSHNAVELKASELGLNVREAQGYLCIRDTARELGIGKTTVQRWVARLGIRPKGRGKARYLTDQDVQRIRESHRAVRETYDQWGRRA